MIYNTNDTSLGTLRPITYDPKRNLIEIPQKPAPKGELCETALLIGEGEKTKSQFQFSSSLLVIDNFMTFQEFDRGYIAVLERHIISEGPYIVDPVLSLGIIKGFMPEGIYGVKDLGEDVYTPKKNLAKETPNSLEFAIDNSGIYVSKGEKILLDKNNQDQIDVSTLLLSAAFTQTLYHISEDRQDRRIIKMEFSDSIKRYNHGCFLRLK